MNRLEITIDSMDRAGLAKSLISAWVAPRNVMISNDEVAGFVSEYPDRLIGIGSVDISKPMAAVELLSRANDRYNRSSTITQLLQYFQNTPGYLLCRFLIHDHG